jgi:hypothetical protein
MHSNQAHWQFNDTDLKNHQNKFTELCTHLFLYPFNSTVALFLAEKMNNLSSLLNKLQNP